MNCDEFADAFRRTLDEAWERDDLAPSGELQAHATACPSCRIRMHAALALHDRNPEGIPVPAGLDRKVTGTIVASRRRGPRRAGRLLAAAALLVIVTASLTVVAVRASDAGTVVVHLVLEAPTASSVAVVGDFNGWNPTEHLLRDEDGDGTWELRFRVRLGREYEYQFVVDEDRRTHDPNALLHVDDGFGGRNSVLDI